MATSVSAGHGGLSDVALAAALAEASLIVHCPPDVPPDAEIIGVCAVDETNAGPNRLGWIAADFMVWKTLFHGVGDAHHQHWFSTLDIKKFSKEFSGFDLEAGDNGEKILGKHRDQIAGLPANNALFIREFLDLVATRARVASERNTTLLIMCFSPVTAEQTIVVDFGMEPQGRKAYIPVDWLRGFIRDAVGHDMPVVFLTPSPLTGGWMCRPTLFLKQIVGATSESIRRIIAKTCGGIFADSCIKLFTTRDTPLLTTEQRAGVRYHDMVPVGPTDYQTMKLHLFQRGIHEALERRACPLAKSHFFHFDPETDAWATLAPRRHHSLVEFWGKKWDQGGVIDEVGDRFAFLGEAHGGTRASQIFWLKYLTSVELETCPGDWGKGVTGPTPTIFRNFILDEDPTDGTFKRVFDTVEFRSSSMAFAHITVKALDLDLPGADCRFWIDEEGQNDHVYPLMRTSFPGILNLFDLPAVFPGEIRHDYMYIRFYRASRWMAAATAMKFLKSITPAVAIEPFIDNKIAPLINQVRQMQYSILKEDGRLRDLGVKWLKSLNLGIALPDTERPVDSPRNPATQREPAQVVKTPAFQAPVSPFQFDYQSAVQAYPEPYLQAGFHTPSKLNVNAKPYVPVQKQDLDQGPNDHMSWRPAQPVTIKAGKPNINLSAARAMIHRQIGNPVEKKLVKIGVVEDVTFKSDIVDDTAPAESEKVHPDISAEVAAVDTERTTKTDEPVEDEVSVKADDAAPAKFEKAQPDISVEVAAADTENTTKAEGPVEDEVFVKADDPATAGIPVDNGALDMTDNLVVDYDAFFSAAKKHNDLLKAKAENAKAEQARAEETTEELEAVGRPVLVHWDDCASKVDDVEKMATADDDLKDLLAKDWTKKAEVRPVRPAYKPMQSTSLSERLERIKNRDIAASPIQKLTATGPAAEVDDAENAVGGTVEKTDEKKFEETVGSDDVFDNAVEQAVQDYIEPESSDGYATAFEQHVDDVSVKLEDMELPTSALDSIQEADSTTVPPDATAAFLKTIKDLMDTDPTKALELMSSFKLEALTSGVESGAREATQATVDKESSTTGFHPPQTPFSTPESLADRQINDHESSIQESEKADENEDLQSVVSLNTAPENTFLTEVSEKADEFPKASVTPTTSAAITAPGLATEADFWASVGW